MGPSLQIHGHLVLSQFRASQFSQQDTVEILFFALARLFDRRADCELPLECQRRERAMASQMKEIRFSTLFNLVNVCDTALDNNPDPVAWSQLQRLLTPQIDALATALRPTAAAGQTQAP